MECFTTFLLLVLALFQWQVVKLEANSLGGDSHSFMSSLHQMQDSMASLPSESITEQCRQTIRNLSMNERWQYLDAAGKPESGVLRGNVKWFGSFDECLHITRSRYCLLTVEGKFGLNITQSLSLGVCVPDACVKNDLVIAVEDFLRNVTSRYFSTLHLRGHYSGAGVNCYEEPPFTAGVILTIVFCGILSALCLVGTITEMIQESFTVTKDHVCASVSDDDIKPSEEQNGILEREILKLAQANEATPLLKHQEKPKELDGFIGRNRVTESVKLKIPKENESAEKMKKEKDDEKESLNEPHNLVVEFLLCFSLLRNSRKVMNVDVHPEAITSLNGLRVISMFWVVLGHVYVQASATGIVENLLDIREVTRKLSMMVITNAFFCVDTFFFLSGLLLSYHVFMHLKNDGQVNWAWFYAHRYLRLTPTMMFVILFVAELEPFVDRGPLWYYVLDDQRCKDYWWTNLLYINNFYPTTTATDVCLIHTWYLALDMQYFVISPVMIYLFFRYGIKGAIGTSLFLIFACTITVAAIVAHYNLDPMAMGRGSGDVVDFYDYVYSKPYCRIQPYVVGFVVGYLMQTKLFRAKMIGWPVAMVSWVLVITVGLCLVYAPHGALEEDARPWTLFEKMLYASTERLLWGFCLAWVVYACEYGYGGYVKEFLSAKFWIPLSRLTYSAYLIHFNLLHVMFLGHRTGLHFSQQFVAYYYCGALLLSYALGFVLAVVVEFPCANIEKMVMKRKQKRGKY